MHLYPVTERTLPARLVAGERDDLIAAREQCPADGRADRARCAGEADSGHGRLGALAGGLEVLLDEALELRAWHGADEPADLGATPEHHQQRDAAHREPV